MNVKQTAAIAAKTANALWDILRAHGFTVESQAVLGEFVAACDELSSAADALEEISREVSSTSEGSLETAMAALDAAVGKVLSASIGVGVVKYDALSGSSCNAVNKLWNPE